jgi:hypothetical protein
MASLTQAEASASRLALIARTIDVVHLARRIHQHYPYLLPLEHATELAGEYARFLELKILAEDWNVQKLSPGSYVDKAWHLHVLDTARYAADCLSVCGHVIHHTSDAVFHPLEVVKERRTRTRQMYLEVFQHEPPLRWWGEEESPGTTIVRVSSVGVPRRASY